MSHRFASKCSQIFLHTTYELSHDLDYDCIGAEYMYMTTACQDALVLACLYEVVEGRIGARDGSTIINRKKVKADVKKLHKRIDI